MLLPMLLNWQVFVANAGLPTQADNTEALLCNTHGMHAQI